MSNELLKTLSSNIDASTIAQIAGSLGVGQQQTNSAVSAALPMLLGGLARNAQKPGGAEALSSALDKNHDGTLLSNLGSLLGGGAQQSSGGAFDLLGMAASFLGSAPGPTSNKSVDGAGILGHVFGARQNDVNQAVSQQSGLDVGKAAQLMTVLAPIVMSALGKSKRESGTDASGLASMLQGATQGAAGGQQGGGNIFASLLDKDGDGSIADDLAAAAGKNLLGSLFK